MILRVILIKLNRIPKKRQLNYLRMIINKFKFANAVVVVLANLNKKLKILIILFSIKYLTMKAQLRFYIETRLKYFINP